MSTNITNIYVIYDDVAEESGPIFHAKNDGVALRNARDVISKSINPDDFSLYKLGKFNFNEMLIMLEEEPKVIGEISNESSKVN